MKVPQLPTTWKGVIGISILVAMLVSMGMQVQSWIDAHERANIEAVCERRILGVRDSFASRARERDGVVDEVKALANDIRATSAKTLQLLQQRVPVTDRIARKVDVIDEKARTAAAESHAAKDEATRAARAAEANTAVAPVAAGAINATVRAVNRGSK